MKAHTGFCISILFHVLAVRCKVLQKDRVFDLFERVLLADSTTLSLPQILAEDFPGNMSDRQQKAVARLQCIINIRSMKRLHLSLSAFTDNE